MILIDTWPSAPAARHEQHRQRGIGAMSRRDFGTAATEFEMAAAALSAAQPNGHRYHKGESLHNAGLARLLNGDLKGGLETTVCASSKTP
jgi:hypothetical protein